MCPCSVIANPCRGWPWPEIGSKRHRKIILLGSSKLWCSLFAMFCLCISARQLFIVCALYGRVAYNLWSAKWTEVAFLEPSNVSITLSLSLWITQYEPLLTWCVAGRHFFVGAVCYSSEFWLSGFDEAGINKNLIRTLSRRDFAVLPMWRS
jgi:hypothetical protein